METLQESESYGLLKTGELLRQLANSSERQVNGWHNLGNEVVIQLFGSNMRLNHETRHLLSALGFIVEKIGLAGDES